MASVKRQQAWKQKWRGEAHSSPSAGAPSPCKGCLPLGRALPIIPLRLSFLRSLGWHYLLHRWFRDHFGPLLSKILHTLHLIHTTRSLCVHMCGCDRAQRTPSAAISQVLSASFFLKVFLIRGTWNSLSRPSWLVSEPWSACPILPILECLLPCLAIFLGGLKSNSGTE